MLLTTQIDIIIEGTLNQDFDCITGTETIDDAIDIYTKGVATQDHQALKKEVLAFLSINDRAIKSEFKTRYFNYFRQKKVRDCFYEYLRS